MKLFHLRRPDQKEVYAGWYSFNAIASTEAEARLMHPENCSPDPNCNQEKEDYQWDGAKWVNSHNDWVDGNRVDPETITVTIICDVADDAPPGPLRALFDEG